MDQLNIRDISFWGLCVVIPLSTGFSGDGVVSRLEEHGVFVGQVQSTADQCAKGGIIVGYGAESVTRMLQGIEKIAGVVSAV